MIESNTTFEETMAIKEVESDYIDIMTDMGIIAPEVVCCQIILETGNFQSKIYKENNNICGMKYSPNSKYAIGELNGHAAYNTPAESLLDYRDWQRRLLKNRVILTNEDYIYFLGHLYKRKEGGYARYATDRDYEEKIRRLLKFMYQ